MKIKLTVQTPDVFPDIHSHCFHYQWSLSSQSGMKYIYSILGDEVRMINFAQVETKVIKIAKERQDLMSQNDLLAQIHLLH